MNLQEHTIQPSLSSQNIPFKNVVDDLPFSQLAFEWYQSEKQLEKKVEDILIKYESLEKDELMDNMVSAKNCDIDLTELSDIEAFPTREIGN